jgi:hypothetical protein
MISRFWSDVNPPGVLVRFLYDIVVVNGSNYQEPIVFRKPSLSEPFLLDEKPLNCGKDKGRIESA